MVEIGPGLGALTAPLAAVLRHLHVIEIDRDIIARLRARYPPERVVGARGRRARIRLCRRCRADLRVVGNLPYNISTPLLFHLAALRRAHTRHAFHAAEGSGRAHGGRARAARDYGRLSVMLQYRFDMDLPSACPRSLLAAAEGRFGDRAPGAARRRKARGEGRGVLRARRDGRLHPAAQDAAQCAARAVPEPVFALIGIDPGLRGETLSVAEFVAIADAAGPGGG